MITEEFKVGQVIEFDPTIVHEQYALMSMAWQKCRDAVAGGVVIKSKTTDYLARLNSRQDQKDYDDYLDRAYWYGATGKSVDTLLSMVFRKSPALTFEEDEADTVKITQIQDVLSRVTSTGHSFEDFSRETLEEILIVNRVGILEDFPEQLLDPEGNAILLSQFDEEELGRRSFSAVYKTEDILNWRVEMFGADLVPSLYVLREKVEDSKVNSFVPGKKDQYRILYLFKQGDETGQVEYRQIVIEPVQTSSDSGAIEYRVISVITPLMDGKPLTRIPFWVLDDDGVTTTDVEVPLIYDLAEVNIAHYRNTADYERELHTVAIKTAIFPGWDKRTNGDPEVGGALGTPPDQIPFILESKNNSPLDTEMKQKEERMATLGAQLLAHKGRFVESAETAQIHGRGESSVVASVARSTGAGLSEVLMFKLAWSGFPDTLITLTLNTDFDEMMFSAQDMTAVTALLQAGTISFKTFFYAMQKMEMYSPNWTREQELEAMEEDKETFGVDSEELQAVMDVLTAMQTQINDIQGDAPDEPDEPGEEE